MALIKDDPLTAHDALSSLINLSAIPELAKPMADPQFLYDLVLMIIVIGIDN
jgi:hypothetical protein